ncbi:MAG: hypothetical protein ACI9E1_000238 [Cryomorphaceae bacterium]|jgi:uncharacterized protein involved in exopolysaccharide biosynthesis
MKRILILIFLSLISLLGGFAYFKMIVRQYESVSIIKFTKYNLDSGKPTSKFSTKEQIQVFKNEQLISRVIEDFKLDLNFEWPAKDLKEIISKSIEITQEDGTDLLSVKTFSSTKERAQKINFALIATYQLLREEAFEERRKRILDEFLEKRKKQEAIVEQRRKKVEELSKKMGVPYDRETRTATEEGTVIRKTEDENQRKKTTGADIKKAEKIPQVARSPYFSSIHLHQSGWSPRIEKSMILIRDNK